MCHSLCLALMLLVAGQSPATEQRDSGGDSSHRHVTKEYRLQNASAPSAYDVVLNLLRLANSGAKPPQRSGTTPEIIVNPQRNSLVVNAPEGKAKVIDHIIAIVDRPSKPQPAAQPGGPATQEQELPIRLFRLTQPLEAELEAELEKSLSELGHIFYDRAAQAVIIKDYPENILKIGRRIEQLQLPETAISGAVEAEFFWLISSEEQPDTDLPLPESLKRYNLPNLELVGHCVVRIRSGGTFQVRSSPPGPDGLCQWDLGGALERGTAGRFNLEIKSEATCTPTDPAQPVSTPLRLQLVTTLAANQPTLLSISPFESRRNVLVAIISESN